ncbi:MAG: hypothetical protein COV74_02650 [Candidatus Omnitrophica bacterium CG11_big_fil_rev_8_21_14_0_20_45_26]|uniref:TVP38/TMEM64 family membrane protein n=1 Tax=Candidatus Abzuiibacterium crystallinum TaxID=1974748 RepID=A0A2H0LRA1_9BACT|nr:MAG: hypothetical protein COV74_02650 [Candidatus Omnitrophica bacterium CG11_big_fil_rev_8_21_14_0_20_45_26]PIW65578.1 MAG: hypothetical protein COW12_01270 [Candidatus Omnitrophica bacterium CG12_big_fil_rev_8_21_14_0_65_45_16]
MPTDASYTKKARLKIAGLLIAVGILLFLTKYFHVQDLAKQALAWIAGLGPAGIAAYMMLYILACVFLIPGSILTLGAGILFGVWHGSIIVSVAATLGATAAFLTGRYLARDWVARQMTGNAKFQAVDQAVAREGWKIVGLTRLSPVFPFNVLNYTFGLTNVSLQDYVLASWIGMMPGTVMYVYIGSLAGDLAQLSVHGHERTPLEWGLYLIGLAATVMVTIYVTRIAKRALQTKISEEKQ